MIRIALAVASVFSIQSALADCAPPAKAKISVNMNAAPVVQDQKWSRAEIKDYMRKRGQSIRPGYDSVLGITESDIEPKARLQFTGTPDRTGTYCVVVQSVTVVIDWKVTVHIASEYKPGSCMYKVIDEHEQGHVEIANKSKGAVQEAIRKALESIVRNTVVASSMDQGATQLQADAQAAFEKAFRKFHAGLEQRQAAHDTPEEYAKGRKICGDEYND